MSEKTKNHFVLNSDPTKQHGRMANAFLLGAVFACVIAAHNFTKVGSETLIVHHFKAKGIPTGDLINLVITGLFYRILGSSRMRYSTGLAIGVGVFCAVFIVFPFIYAALPELTARMLYVGEAFLIYSGILMVWALFASRRDKESIKEITVFGAFGQIGAILGAEGSNLLLSSGVSPQGFLPIAGVLYSFAFTAMIWQYRTAPCFAAEVNIPKNNNTTTHWRRSSILTWLMVLVTIETVFIYITRWSIYNSAAQFADTQKIAAFLASFFRVSAWVALAIQLTLVPLCLTSFRRHSLFVQPTIAILCLIALLLVGNPTMSASVIAAYMSCSYTMQACSRENLFVTESAMTKVTGKPLVSVFAPQVGTLFAACFTLYMSGFIGRNGLLQSLWCVVIVWAAVVAKIIFLKSDHRSMHDYASADAAVEEQRLTHE